MQFRPTKEQFEVAQIYENFRQLRISKFVIIYLFVYSCCKIIVPVLERLMRFRFCTSKHGFLKPWEQPNDIKRFITTPSPFPHVITTFSLNQCNISSQYLPCIKWSWILNLLSRGLSIKIIIKLSIPSWKNCLICFNFYMILLWSNPNYW